MRSRLGRFVGTMLVVGVGTWVMGWWAVPVVAAAGGWVCRGDRRTPVITALGVAAGWGGLLLWSAWIAPLDLLLDRVAPIFSLTPALFLAVTLAWPALLALLISAVVRRVSS